MQTQHLRGLWVAAATPLAADGSIDHPAFARHVRRILESGCDGVAIFGTTGEGQSFSVTERIEALDALLRAGIPASRIVSGTGCAALPDAIELTRHAVRSDIAAAMLLPPFFWKGVDDAGVAAAIGATIDGVSDPRMRAILYHIPSVSAVSVEPGAMTMLRRSHGEAILGIKDSSADWDHYKRGLDANPGLLHFVGAELHFVRAVAAGGAGTICGLGNVVPRTMTQLRDGRSEAVRASALARVAELVPHFSRGPFLPLLKQALAELTGEPGWARVRAPLTPAPTSASDGIVALARSELEPVV
jgi:4-hydroxy-tetrahydrodipicolinate synthase